MSSALAPGLIIRMGGDPTTHEADTLRVGLRPLAPADLPVLCTRLVERLEGRPGTLVVCDVSELPADAVAVDALARMQLTAQRVGCRVVLDRAPPELIGLIALFGLADVLGCRAEAEQREEPIRVEERVERRDPPV
jgi:ABC-type transporter Mla MlaB component